jgi:hypothetical protein
MKATPNTEFLHIDGSIDTDKAMEAGQDARTAAIKAFVKYAANVIGFPRRPFVEA